jgi:hypothetical protein
MAVIHAELGESVPVVMEGPFLLAGPGWTEASLRSVTTLVRRALAALYDGRFSKRPTLPVAVYLFPSAAPYESFCHTHLGEACMSDFGFYRPDARTIVMNAGPGIGTLTHEMVHPLVEADFGNPPAPDWIDEGLASLFEAPVLTNDGAIHGAKNWRLPRLKSALVAKKDAGKATLPNLFAMSDATFRDDDESLHYAMARYACQWLDEHDLLWTFYRSWRDHAKTDPTGEQAFFTATGMTPAQANAAWQAWVRAL